MAEKLGLHPAFPRGATALGSEHAVSTNHINLSPFSTAKIFSLCLSRRMIQTLMAQLQTLNSLTVAIVGLEFLECPKEEDVALP